VYVVRPVSHFLPFIDERERNDKTTKLRNLPERAESGVGFRDLAGRRRSVEGDGGGNVCLKEQCRFRFRFVVLLWWWCLECYGEEWSDREVNMLV
jgi:hypothetical protein